MLTIPSELRQRFQQYGQEHVFAWWDQLDDARRKELLDQLQALNLEEIAKLYERRAERFALPDRNRIKSIDRMDPDPAAVQKFQALGVNAWRHGQVAILIVAGGQGSRLGFDHPKGMFRIGPVTQKTLFQIHAEKVLALGRRFEISIPLLIMTSPATHQETVDFFAGHQFFGLSATDISFFCQGTMPALDLATGKLLMEAPGRLFTSPNGHGGILTALVSSGLLQQLRDQGIQTLFYFQVDNPLVDVVDTVFLGGHLNQHADLSSKVLVKETPGEKLGLFVLVDGRLTIIEYSDLPDDLARQTDANGLLTFWAGNPAIHLFQLAFLERITRDKHGLPWHVARKKVPCFDAAGQLMTPKTENALKFERFIFDAFPPALSWWLAPMDRHGEFMPLKNASGPDCPETVRQGMSNLAGAWLERAGVTVPRQKNGDVAFPLEISPLFALDAAELAAKADPAWRIDGPRYFG
ncbi:MAG TPA: UDPGP type 1 family protein [Gemmataceae bacterium]|nr:UDPGP type 1 family protein [Gemmataceae bacterium]